jgi:hypothetical protein
MCDLPHLQPRLSYLTESENPCDWCYCGRFGVGQVNLVVHQIRGVVEFDHESASAQGRHALILLSGLLGFAVVFAVRVTVFAALALVVVLPVPPALVSVAGAVVFERAHAHLAETVTLSRQDSWQGMTG